VEHCSFKLLAFFQKFAIFHHLLVELISFFTKDLFKLSNLLFMFIFDFFKLIFKIGMPSMSMLLKAIQLFLQ